MYRTRALQGWDTKRRVPDITHLHLPASMASLKTASIDFLEEHAVFRKTTLNFSKERP
jgi:hypothetical protein